MVIYIGKYERVCANCEHFQPSLVKAEDRTMVSYIGICEQDDTAKNATVGSCKNFKKKEVMQ